MMILNRLVCSSFENVTEAQEELGRTRLPVLFITAWSEGPFFEEVENSAILAI